MKSIKSRLTLVSMVVLVVFMVLTAIALERSVVKRALQAEELPFEKLRYVLNRAPKFTDLNGKSRVKRLGESLDISVEVQMPDGGKPVSQAADHGLPLASAAAKNPLRREIAKLAQSLHEFGRDEAEAARGLTRNTG